MQNAKGAETLEVKKSVDLQMQEARSPALPKDQASLCRILVSGQVMFSQLLLLRPASPSTTPWSKEVQWVLASTLDFAVETQVLIQSDATAAKRSAHRCRSG